MPFEQELEKARSKELGGRVHRGLEALYQEAETRSATSTSFVLLGHLFDEVQEPLYIDEFHLDARGNQIIAQAVQRSPQCPEPPVQSITEASFLPPHSVRAGKI